MHAKNVYKRSSDCVVTCSRCSKWAIKHITGGSNWCIRQKSFLGWHPRTCHGTIEFSHILEFQVSDSGINSPDEGINVFDLNKLVSFIHKAKDVAGAGLGNDFVV